MAIERTNLQLTYDTDGLKVRATTLEGKVNLNYVNLSRTGLKDASGTNGDVFLEDSSLYLKLSDYWNHVICVSLGPL